MAAVPRSKQQQNQISAAAVVGLVGMKSAKKPPTSPKDARKASWKRYMQSFAGTPWQTRALLQVLLPSALRRYNNKNHLNKDINAKLVPSHSPPPLSFSATADASSSSSSWYGSAVNVWALLLTLCFSALLIFQGLSSSPPPQPGIHHISSHMKFALHVNVASTDAVKMEVKVFKPNAKAKAKARLRIRAADLLESSLHTHK